MSDLLLRKKLIRLAHENPELRADLLPLLKQSGSPHSTAHTSKAPNAVKYRERLTGTPVSKGDLATHLKILEALEQFEVARKNLLRALPSDDLAAEFEKLSRDLQYGFFNTLDISRALIQVEGPKPIKRLGPRKG